MACFIAVFLVLFHERLKDLSPKSHSLHQYNIIFPKGPVFYEKSQIPLQQSQGGSKAVSVVKTDLKILRKDIYASPLQPPLQALVYNKNYVSVPFLESSGRGAHGASEETVGKNGKIQCQKTIYGAGGSRHGADAGLCVQSAKMADQPSARREYAVPDGGHRVSGASPERVESEVSDVTGRMPSARAGRAEDHRNIGRKLQPAADGVYRRYGYEQRDGQGVQQAGSGQSDLPSTCLTPSIIEYSLNMNAFMTVAVSREGADQYQLVGVVSRTPWCRRCSARAVCPAFRPAVWWKRWCRCSSNQDEDRRDQRKAAGTRSIPSWPSAVAAGKRRGTDVTAGRKEYEKQLKNLGNTVSNWVMSQMSTEVGARSGNGACAQAQALLESVNQPDRGGQEPEIQQALDRGARRPAEGHGQVRQHRYAGYRLSDRYRGPNCATITDKLTTALQKLQERDEHRDRLRRAAPQADLATRCSCRRA